MVRPKHPALKRRRDGSGLQVVSQCGGAPRDRRSVIRYLRQMNNRGTGPTLGLETEGSKLAQMLGDDRGGPR
jgi:hypothetical protein